MQELLRKGIDVEVAPRGGEVTYHGEPLGILMLKPPYEEKTYIPIMQESRLRAEACVRFRP